MASDNELTEFINKQIGIEKEIVDSLNQALAKMENLAVHAALKAISLDSVKHADMYSAAVKLLTSPHAPLWQEHLDEHRGLVEKHIRLEASLIQRINEVVLDLKNVKVKLLLNAILADEKRHHELLKNVLEIIVRGETITEEEWWDFMWKEASKSFG